MSFISKLWRVRPGPLLNDQFHFPEWIKKHFSLFLVLWVVSGALQYFKLLKSFSLESVFEQLDSFHLLLCPPLLIRMGRLFCHEKEVSCWIKHVCYCMAVMFNSLNKYSGSKILFQLPDSHTCKPKEGPPQTTLHIFHSAEWKCLLLMAFPM